MNKVVVYYRVSKQEKGLFSKGLKEQQKILRRYIRRNSLQACAEYSDVLRAYRGVGQQLLNALHHCSLSGADLLIADIDRLSGKLQQSADLLLGDIRIVSAGQPGESMDQVRLRLLHDLEQQELLTRFNTERVNTEQARRREQAESDKQIQVLSKQQQQVQAATLQAYQTS